MAERVRSVITGIVLAAGASSRMGETKQLLRIGGRPLVQLAIDAASGAGVEEVLVVLGHHSEEIHASIHLPPGGRVVLNRDAASGLASSLRVGLEAASAETRAAVVLLADQPRVGSEAVRSVLAIYERSGGPVVRARYGPEPGHPVVLGREVWEEILKEEGDHGAGPVLDRHPEWIVWAAVEGASDDVDTPADFRRLGEGGFEQG